MPVEMHLFDDQPRPQVPDHRVRALAGVIAGFRWPASEGRGSFERLKKGQQKLALDIARQALERLAAEGED